MSQEKMLTCQQLLAPIDNKNGVVGAIQTQVDLNKILRRRGFFNDAGSPRNERILSGTE